MAGAGQLVLIFWTACAAFLAVAGFFLYLVLSAATLDPGNVWGVTSCLVIAIVSGFLAIVASRKAAAANRVLTSDAYVRIEDGYGVDDDLRGSMYDPFGQLKPVHQQCLLLIQAVADESSGLTIKKRKIGMREVKPCIVGFRFIDWAIREGHAKTRPDAIELGNMLIRKKYLLRSDGKTSSEHKTRRGRELASFLDDSVFYFFAVQERPKLFAPLPDDVRDRLLYGFRPEKLGTPGLVLMPVGIFGVPLGVASYAVVWTELGTVFAVPWLLIVGWVLAGAALLLFGVTLYAYIYKAVQHFSAVKDEWEHPFKVNQFGMITITWLLFSVIGGSFNVTVAQVFFYTGTFLQLFVTLNSGLRWVKLAENLTLHDINPSYFIPIIGLAMIPIAAWPADIDEFGWLMLGAAIVYWLLMFAIMFLRMFFVAEVYRSSRPMLFYAVAPPALIAIAYLTLIAVRPTQVGATPQYLIDPFARMLYGVSLFNTCLFIVIRIGTPRVPFMLVHWAYVFPLAMFAVATIRYAIAIRGAVTGGGVGQAANGLTILLVVATVILASVVFVWAVALTIITGGRKRLVGRESKVLSDETAAKVYQGKMHSGSSSYRATTRQ